MRTFLICVIATIVIGLATIETVFVGNVFKDLKGKTTELHQLVNAEENIDKQKELITKIKSKWEKSEGFLSIFLQHKEMEDLAEQISIVDALIEHYDGEELKIQVHQLQYFLTNFHFIYDFNLVNVF